MDKPMYIVGIDGSEWAIRALERAILLAEKTGAKVKLVQVITPILSEPFVVDGGIVPMIKNEDEKKMALNILSSLCDQYKKSNIHLDSEVLRGDPAEVLHDKTKTEHANMLFVGRRGRSRLSEIIVGSVSNKLAHSIGIPIVLVP
jgi:nucleotide-binding universal stress UspA family protein